MDKLSKEQKQQIVQLRVEGNTPTSIAKQMGISYQLVKKIAAKADRTLGMERQQIQALSLLRLERLVQAYLPLALNGEIKAGELLIKVINQQCKLGGLDSPQIVNATNIAFNKDMTNEEVRDGLKAVLPILTKRFPNLIEVKDERTED